MATSAHKLVGGPNVVHLADKVDARASATREMPERTGYRVLIFANDEASPPLGLAANSGVLLDMRMRGGNGLELLRALLGQGQGEEAIEAARLAVADPLEEPGPHEPSKATRDALETRPAVAKAAAGDPDAAARIATLSERQRQVLQGMLEGKLNKTIAHELGISVRTVESYRAVLLIKLGVRGTIEAVRLAFAAGMLV